MTYGNVKNDQALLYFLIIVGQTRVGTGRDSGEIF